VECDGAVEEDGYWKIAAHDLEGFKGIISCMMSVVSARHSPPPPLRVDMNHRSARISQDPKIVTSNLSTSPHSIAHEQVGLAFQVISQRLC
jgi:hypothetical protein